MSGKMQDAKVKKGRTLDEEIAIAAERLNRLRAQKVEKERKDLERNQKAISALLRTEKLDLVPVEVWEAALPGIRKLLKAEEPKPDRTKQSNKPTAVEAAPKSTDLTVESKAA